jgi:drug/metabolite transporter (DMT)-like permease
MWVYLKLLVTALVWGGTFVAVSAIFLAFFILGEPITWSLLVGGLFVISGVYLANIRSYEPFQTSP